MRVNKKLCLKIFFNTTGAAHGLCFILQVLMTAPGFFQTFPDAERDVRGSLDYLLSVQSPEGDFPCTTDEAPIRHSGSALVHWCHGAPGKCIFVPR